MAISGSIHAMAEQDQACIFTTSPFGLTEGEKGSG